MEGRTVYGKKEEDVRGEDRGKGENNVEMRVLTKEQRGVKDLIEK